MAKYVVMDLKEVDINLSALKIVDPPSLSFKVVVGGATGGYVYDKIVSKALDGTVFDVA